MKEFIYNTDDVNVTLKNLEKKFWPNDNFSKGDLLNYYDKAGPFLLPYIKKRPFTMKRYPDGIDGKHFFQKDCPDYAPDWLGRVAMGKREKVIDYIIINKVADILWVVNQGCIDMHTWLASYTNPTKPDIAVFDLDPAEGSTWQDVLSMAKIIREALESIRLMGYPKTSGSKGLHIYIPIQPLYSYSQVQNFIRGLAEMIASAYPEKATTARNIKDRKNKVYIDYLQNGAGRTMASVFSVRPVPGATVSMPISWEEVEQRSIHPYQFTMTNVLDQIRERDTLFQGVLTKRQKLPPIH
ncbi:non-homologous end-joining DNA ligase [Metallumcola ferriviriculae]|uniref:Non-homologous end-joining DNA ligase n=1 Tax=Metallumcola ferriviriculae TaxID=3039180 RepID=A0AAU0ULL0_9FIRM|nr:non-homologous end-joining DNA ligase [Desulfitibacteraceae bacterium MK1]